MDTLSVGAASSVDGGIAEVWRRATPVYAAPVLR
jgi:hypothetical protein